MTQEENSTKGQIGLITAISIVVANMIGTGVFTSLGFQVIDLKSGFSLLFLWLVGGVFALTGALCYGELGAAMPRSGGEVNYLSKIYHPVVGFLSGWVSVTVGFAAPIAAAAIAFGKYFANVVPFNQTILALIVVIGVTLIHTQALKVGSYFQTISTVLKMLLIIGFIILGLVLAKPQTISFNLDQAAVKDILSVPFAISLVYVGYSYSGWNASIYIASELKEPEKTLPKSLLMGTLMVMVCYLLLNFVFLYTTPIDILKGKEDVGYIVASNILGPVGGKIMAFLISFGLISSISSMVWAGPRVTQTIGEDFPLFRILAKKNQNGIPYYALMFQLTIVIFFVISSTFDAVITYLGFTLTLGSFMTVLGLFIHRFRFADHPRPYKTWGYPITGLVFLGISLWILIFTFLGKPWESLAGLGTIALGLPVYYLGTKYKIDSIDSSEI